MADEIGNVSKNWGKQYKIGMWNDEKGKSRNTTPLLGLKTTRLHEWTPWWSRIEGVLVRGGLRRSCTQ